MRRALLWLILRLDAVTAWLRRVYNKTSQEPESIRQAGMRTRPRQMRRSSR